MRWPGLRRIEWAELIAGLALVLVGGFIAWEASGYPFGTPMRIGPAFFPVILGGLLAALGLAVIAQGVGRAPVPTGVRLRPLAAILAAILAFALLIRPWGLISATLALVMIASLAEDRPRPLRALGLAAVMAAVGALLFVRGFGVPVAVFPW